jgi:aromatic ring-opening dioxygenase catalytic subunit (LigB family)
MSLYQVQKLLFQLHNDLELRARYKADSRTVLKGYDLSDPETKVLLEADVGSLSLAKGLLHFGIENGVDFAFSEEMILDHAFMVPLHYLTPQMDLPVVPIHINSLLSPRPSAGRCYRVGQQIAEFIRSRYDGRVAILASGSFSGDIGGPKMRSVDTPFDMEFLDLVTAGKVEEFVRKATPEALERAGVANELLVWVTLFGALGPLQPSFTDYICGKGWSTAATLASWNLI